jgi:3-dehydroquinate dehydratase-2
MRILVLHGPNLNLLGNREPDIYGTDTLDSINQRLSDQAKTLDVELRFLQSNHEGVLIDALHDNREWMHGLLLNPAAYTHTSIALRDAVLSVGKPMIEVHLSDLSKREDFRHKSYFSDIAVKTVSGKKAQSYYDGLSFLVTHLKTPKNP